jgi:hypothetical protein
MSLRDSHARSTLNILSYEFMVKQTMKASDVFSVFAGAVGLLADFIGLGGLLIVSRSSSSASPIIWVLVFVGILYSIAFTSFIVRRRMFKTFSEQIKALNTRRTATVSTEMRRERAKVEALNVDRRARINSYVKKIDSGVLSATLLVGIPLSVCFFLAVFYADATEYGFVLEFLPLLSIGYEDLIYTLVGGIFYGSFLGYTVVLIIDQVVRRIYLALEADYPEERDYVQAYEPYD